MIMRGHVRSQIPIVGLVLIGLAALATIPSWTIGHEQRQRSPSSSLASPVALQFVTSPATKVTAPAALKTQSEPLTAAANGEPFISGDTAAVPEEGIGSLEAQPAAAAATDPIATAVTPPSKESDGSVSAWSNALFVASGGLPGAPASNEVDQAKRLQLLEAQLARLMAEVRSLRTQKAVATRPAANARAGSASKAPAAIPVVPYRAATHPADFAEAPMGSEMLRVFGRAAAKAVPASPYGPGVETVVITRATYKVPPGVAQQFESALRQLLDDEIEIKLKGDSLQITASDDDQAAVAQIIRLMERKARQFKGAANVPVGPATDAPYVPFAVEPAPQPRFDPAGTTPSGNNGESGDSREIPSGKPGLDGPFSVPMP